MRRTLFSQASSLSRPLLLPVSVGSHSSIPHSNSPFPLSFPIPHSLIPNSPFPLSHPHPLSTPLIHSHYPIPVLHHTTLPIIHPFPFCYAHSYSSIPLFLFCDTPHPCPVVTPFYYPIPHMLIPIPVECKTVFSQSSVLADSPIQLHVYLR